MKYSSKLIKMFAVLWAVLLFLILPQPCYANPINPGFPLYTSNYWVFLWIVCPLIESVIIVSILKYRFSFPGLPLRPFLLTFLLNFISLPISQVFSSALLGQLRAHYVVFLIELFVVVFEFLILNWLFSSLYKRGAITNAVTLGGTLLITLVANLASFLVGFAFYYYWPAPFSPFPHYP
jgi:hypothetical protein